MLGGIPSGTDRNFGLARIHAAVLDLSPHRHPRGHCNLAVRNSDREKSSRTTRKCKIIIIDVQF